MFSGFASVHQAVVLVYLSSSALSLNYQRDQNSALTNQIHQQMPHNSAATLTPGAWKIRMTWVSRRPITMPQVCSKCCEYATRALMQFCGVSGLIFWTYSHEHLLRQLHNYRDSKMLILEINIYRKICKGAHLAPLSTISAHHLVKYFPEETSLLVALS